MTSLLGVCAILALGAFSQAYAADASGTWTWSQPGRNGGEPRKSTLKLKVEGDKVTGTVSSPGRGGQASDTAIENGKISGDEISFTTTREFNGNNFTAKYSGKISGDSIKGKIETARGDNTRSTDWEAKREGGKSKD